VIARDRVIGKTKNLPQITQQITQMIADRKRPEKAKLDTNQH
jgi:hypothetical protein